METKPPLRSDLLQPVQLRLDGLHERLAHLDRTLSEVPDELSENIQRRLERAALFRGLNAIQRSYEAIATVLCLILDGSTPDDEESWYGDALDQLSGTGSGRMPVLSPALADLLREVGIYPDFDPILELDENVEVQRRRHAAALRAAPMLVDALTALDALLADGRLRDGQEPDPEFAKQHAERLKRAETRKQALARALTDIENAFLEKGYRVIPFGSVAENRVHGRSDLDLLVVGEMSRETQRELWNAAEEFAREEGVEVDLHFPGLYSGDFLDRLKAIRGGQIVPLRDLIAAATGPKTQRD
ncbi:nucleotidyltransferase domain-containing protein [Pontitalea aquivivens]|uniref:nucleotidyltransferase domain-containing protein n=1 Tax=Pontitalea aquivivens TaxID=3388663 RepID=UPI003970B109